MSSNPAIVVSDLSKGYPVHDVKPTTLREAVMSRVRHPGRAQTQRFVALDNISLEVSEGEVLGVVGRNGAGKSTLFKVLSRITTPDSGKVDLYGRVGSLLEVGTGFHPELTGRENVFLNGTILGMRRREVARKFDEIVAFSEIDRFIDTPVKRYSSGMYVRLAFAVASHLQSEIMVVDEVLAVGDTGFQAKCLNKMEELALEEGRTVLFVSHAMASVKRLCSRVVVMQRGRLAFDGDPGVGVSHYLDSVSPVSDSDGGGSWELLDRENPHHPDHLWIRRVTVRGDDGNSRSDFFMGEAVTITVDLQLFERLPRAHFGIRISSELDQSLFTFTTELWPSTAADCSTGLRRATVRIPSLPLTPGRYSMAPGLSSSIGGALMDFVQYLGPLQVHAPGCGPGEYQLVHGDGAVSVPVRWTIESPLPENPVILSGGRSARGNDWQA